MMLYSELSFQQASDYGGPRAEFFGAVLRDIKDNYFDAGLKEHLAPDYHTIGCIMCEYFIPMPSKTFQFR